MRRAATPWALGLLLGARITAGAADAVQALPHSAERAYQTMSSRFDAGKAVEVVSFMEQYWRLAGNAGYNASIDHIHEGLLGAGFSTSQTSRSTVRIDEFANQGHGWDYRVGTIGFDADAGGEEPLLSRERDRVSLAINSFSTPAGGLRAPLVDVAGAAPADFAGKEIRGAIVLTDAPLGRVWQAAVRQRGAVGVISTSVASYVRPPGTTQLSETQQDVLQWDAIPFDASLRSFGFKSSWRAAARMRQRLRQGPVPLRVTIDATFSVGPNRTLVAEIAGRIRPDERIVMVAHVQEPGANDNGSGCGTLYALARALNEAIVSGELPAPDRTLTFLWGDEFSGSREWIRAHPEDARGVQYMFALDMTGEDVTRTGGTFLIEKQADPSAVWPRPSDPHSEWGAGTIAPGSLNGSLLNDLHLAVSLRRARDTGWTVRTNPYEGGSDHTVFAAAGVPSLLNWHFTDRYYHTNQDRVGMVSAAEMQNVGIAVATSGWFLASATASDAMTVVSLVERAARERLALELQQGRTLVASAADKPTAEATESKVRAAWILWYGQALDSVRRLPAAGPTDALRRRIDLARRRVD